MTYFLEKTFGIDSYAHNELQISCQKWKTIVRPCKLDYNACRAAFMSNESILLNGAVAFFDPKKWGSLEEWLVDIDLNQGIAADFEWQILDAGDFKCYAMKTIDLHTNEVIEDCEDNVKKFVLDNVNREQRYLL